MAHSRKGLKGVVHSRQAEADQDMVNLSHSSECLQENATAHTALSEAPFCLFLSFSEFLIDCKHPLILLLQQC